MMPLLFCNFIILKIFSTAQIKQWDALTITNETIASFEYRKASILGTYLHGLSGDSAASAFSPEAMIAGDIVTCLGDEFKLISSG